MNKKNLTLLAGASMLVLGVPAVSLAQGTAASGPFADVPADHWAYQSVDTLQKAGIVIGYPDGTYGGKRAMTRYEFAVAIARLMPLLNGAGAGNYATKDDLEKLRSDLESKLQSNSDAIDALRKLVDEFQPELQKLGQDVAAVKDRLDALEARVAAVEVEQRRVKFTGALNLIAKAVNVTKGPSYIDANGTDNLAPKKLLRKTDVSHDFVLGIKGHVSDTATANVKSLGGLLCVELIPGSQIFSGQRVFFIFALPEYCDDPPALSVVHQLNAVDTARKGFFLVLRVARFVGAEEVGDAAEFFGPAGNLTLEETVLFH